MKLNKKWVSVMLMAMLIMLTACGEATNNKEGSSQADTPEKLRKITLMLDYTPNTNHTGLYVARDKGYFAEAGLEVEFLSPVEGGAEAAVAANNVEFGVSYQENTTLARVAGLPIISLAAIIQHNTSGFASPVDKGIDSPKKFEGKTYGGWGSPMEVAVIESVMREDHADFSKLNIINSGSDDFFSAVEKDIDFMWIFYGWTGIEAELRGVDLNMIYVNEYNENLDYYTPILITSEKIIAEDPELVKAFTHAVAKGYQYAIEQPLEAAEVLIAAEPDLNAELVRASQQWLSPYYQDDAARWGEQKLEVWKGYADWMHNNGLLQDELDAEAAFTNKFLP